MKQAFWVTPPQKRRKLSIDQVPVQEIVMLGQQSCVTPEKTSLDRSSLLGVEMAPSVDGDRDRMRGNNWKSPGDRRRRSKLLETWHW